MHMKVKPLDAVILNPTEGFPAIEPNTQAVVIQIGKAEDIERDMTIAIPALRSMQAHYILEDSDPYATEEDIIWVLYVTKDGEEVLEVNDFLEATGAR